MWFVRHTSELRSDEALLQFYGDNFQSQNFREFGLFFVIKNARRPEFANFGLDNYEAAKVRGVFRIDVDSSSILSNVE